MITGVVSIMKEGHTSKPTVGSSISVAVVFSARKSRKSTYFHPIDTVATTTTTTQSARTTFRSSISGEILYTIKLVEFIVTVDYMQSVVVFRPCPLWLNWLTRLGLLDTPLFVTIGSNMEHGTGSVHNSNVCTPELRLATPSNCVASVMCVSRSFAKQQLSAMFGQFCKQQYSGRI